MLVLDSLGNLVLMTVPNKLDKVLERIKTSGSHAAANRCRHRAQAGASVRQQMCDNVLGPCYTLIRGLQDVVVGAANPEKGVKSKLVHKRVLDTNAHIRNCRQRRRNKVHLGRRTG